MGACIICRHWLNSLFHARQTARSAKLVLAIVILSVRSSGTTRYRFKPRWDRDSGFSPYDSLQFLVSNEAIWCRWVRRFPLNEGIKDGYPAPLRSRYFTTVSSSSVRMVADRHWLTAYHNKHCLRAFQGYHCWWPWMTLNPINRRF